MRGSMADRSGEGGRARRLARTASTDLAGAALECGFEGILIHVRQFVGSVRRTTRDCRAIGTGVAATRPTGRGGWRCSG